MDEFDIFNKLSTIYDKQTSFFIEDSILTRRIAKHKLWLASIRHERPATATSYKIGIYIRFFNQTKYENYLDYHIKQFQDTIALCPDWTLVEFYIDKGASAPNMETAPEWGRLINDCMEGKVDLIITQKVANVSRNMQELNMCATILATQEHPIGIYFISEDIFTLSSYYQDDIKETYFLPTDNTNPTL